MGFAQARGGLRRAVFSALGDPAFLNGTTEVRVRVKQREEGLGFGGSQSIAVLTHIDILGLEQAVERGDVFTLEDGRRFKVSSDPILVRSDVRRCPVVEVAP